MNESNLPPGCTDRAIEAAQGDDKPFVRKFHFKGHRIWGWIITTTMQGQGAPIIDSCRIDDEDGNRYEGWAIHLAPWRFNDYGDREINRALVIGRKRK